MVRQIVVKHIVFPHCSVICFHTLNLDTVCFATSLRSTPGRNVFVLFNLFALRNRNWHNASNACKEMEQWLPDGTAFNTTKRWLGSCLHLGPAAQLFGISEAAVRAARLRGYVESPVVMGITER